MWSPIPGISCRTVLKSRCADDLDGAPVRRIPRKKWEWKTSSATDRASRGSSQYRPLYSRRGPHSTPYYLSRSMREEVTWSVGKIQNSAGRSSRSAERTEGIDSAPDRSMSVGEIQDCYATYADRLHRFEWLDRVLTGEYRRERFGDVEGTFSMSRAGPGPTSVTCRTRSTTSAST